jgi:hypothetical protein
MPGSDMVRKKAEEEKLKGLWRFNASIFVLHFVQAIEI